MKNAFTLFELMLVVTILGILACIAVPRMQFASIGQYKAKVLAEQIATDLREARQMAITAASVNNAGFAVKMVGSQPYSSYNVISSLDNSVISSHSIDSSVSCTGGSLYHFGTLGNLASDSSTANIVISSGAEICTLSIIPATGAINVTKNQ
jgi:prepilin-type N-terminal cleavage/methylation domain-containing protein